MRHVSYRTNIGTNIRTGIPYTAEQSSAEQSRTGQGRAGQGQATPYTISPSQRFQAPPHIVEGNK